MSNSQFSIAERETRSLPASIADFSRANEGSPGRRAFRPPAPEPRAQALGPLALLGALKRNPLECFTRRHFEEPVVAGGLPIGHALTVHDPAAIRRILLDNCANYRKDSIQRRVLSTGLGDGLLSAEGARWRVQRRAVAPIFARKTVMDFTSGMAAAATDLVGRLSQEAHGATVDMAVEMARVTLDVLERTVFSEGLGRDAEDIRKAMRLYFNAIGKIGLLDLIGAPDFVPRLSRLRLRPTLRMFESAIDEVIADRRRILAAHPERAPRDILTCLLEALDGDARTRLGPAEVRSNILTFFMAGHETTSNALSWALYLLSQSPEWRERVEAEADRELTGPLDTIAQRLVETRAVVEETIRLYPPVAAISRVALGPDELAGEAVRRGSLIVVSPYVLHRHRRLWDRPDLFDPERFLGQARADIERFAYLPFGAGPRVCVGSAFALQEATIVLATLVRALSFRLEAGCVVWPLLRVTLRPANGLAMFVKPRKPRIVTGEDAACAT